MKTFNLTNPEESDIKYTISKFPDGQQQVTIQNFEEGDDFEWEQQILAYPVTIKSRLNSFMDLELIICAKKALDTLGFNNINLYVPYFLGSRSDRQFNEGSNNYLKDVICPIINSLEFDSVTCIDPHSDVLEACIDNFKKLSNLKLVEFFLHETQGKWKDYDNWQNGITLVSPDAGASKKIYKLAEQIGYKGDIITCSKDRDENGELTKCIIPALDISKDMIIIDDICDGGNTFINIAKEIDKQINFSKNSNFSKAFGKKYLIVTHGIFSKGFDELSKYFDGIYCTNSYSNMDFYPAKPEWSLKLVKQLNVF